VKRTSDLNLRLVLTTQSLLAATST
jgi:hypothetical protein